MNADNTINAYPRSSAAKCFFCLHAAHPTTAAISRHRFGRFTGLVFTESIPCARHAEQLIHSELGQIVGGRPDALRQRGREQTHRQQRQTKSLHSSLIGRKWPKV